MGTSQSVEHLQAPWGLFSAKFKATAIVLCVCVCVFFNSRVVLVFFKCVINLASFLFKSRFISLLLFIHLFFTFFSSD